MVTVTIDFESAGKRWQISLDGHWIAIRERKDDGELISYVVARRRVLEQGKATAVAATLAGIVEVAAAQSVVKDGLESMDLHLRLGRGAWYQGEAPHQWVSTTAAAHMAGCTKKTLLRRFKQGQIPASACRSEGRIILWDSLAVNSLRGNAWSLHQRRVESKATSAANDGSAARWVNTISAARMAGCNRDTLLRRFERGQIPACARRRDGRTVLWDSTAIIPIH